MPEVPPHSRADVVIVGGGVSGTSVLLRLLDEPGPARSILVVDRDGEFCTGVPYGGRAAPASLIISPLRDFLPVGRLGDGFLRWLQGAAPAALSAPSDWGIDPGWTATHGPALLGGTEGWEDLYIPRRLFGRFMRDTVCEALARSQHRVRFLRAEVQTIRQRRTSAGAPDGSVLTVVPPTALPRPASWLQPLSAIATPTGPAQLISPRVVLAIGSPVHRPLPPLPESAVTVSALHTPSAESTLADLEKRLLAKSPDKRTIVVAGGNADALEFIHLSAPLRKRVGAPLRVLAPDGRPAQWVRENAGEKGSPEVSAHFQGGMLEQLVAQPARLTAAALLRAVVTDVERAERENRRSVGIRALSAQVAALVARLDRAERDRMAAGVGMEISRLLLHAGGDALESALADETAGHLTFVTGRLDGSSASSLGSDVGAVVNATGFASVGQAAHSDPLLQSVVALGVRPAPGGRGLLMDDSQLIAPGIWQIGPLTAGHSGPARLVWHAESVRRIVGQADIVAEALRARSEPTSADGAAAGS